MGRAVLEGVWLDAATIESCFRNNPLDEEAAVQAGLVKWVEGTGRQPPTWGALLEAMEDAEIAQDANLPPGEHCLRPWKMQRLHKSTF